MGKLQFQFIKLVLILNFIFEINSVKVSIKSENVNLCIRVREKRKVELGKCFWEQNESEQQKKLEAEQIFDFRPGDVPSEDERDEDGMEKLSSFIIRLPAQKKNNCLSVISSNVTLEKCHLRKSRFRISRIIFKNPSKSCRDNSSDEVRYKIHSSLNSCFDVSTLKSSSPEKTNYFIESSMCSLLKSVEGIRTDSQLWQFCTQNGNCSLNLDDQAWGSLLKTNSQTITAEVNCTEKEITTSTPPEIIAPTGNVFPNHSIDDTDTEDGAVIIEGNGSVSRFSNFFNSALWSIVLFLAFHFAI